MSLQFVLGGSGSGKSEYLYNKILSEAQEDPDTNYLLIVPEQYTMQTQKEIVRRQQNNAIMNIDVLSFQRMAFRVFDELGKTNVTILEETGKNLVLRKIAQDKEPQLTTLKGNMRKLGYISEIKSLISELTQYNISPSDIDKIIEKVNTVPFQMKMRDIQLMYEGFQEYIKDKYVTAEEVLEVLAQEAGRSDMLRNSVIVLDGFTGFTPLQNNLLRRLLKLTKQIVVSLSVDDRIDIYRQAKIQELFYMSKRTVKQLTDLAEECGVDIDGTIWLNDAKNKRFTESGDLYFLEQNIFRRRASNYAKQPENIYLYTLRDPRSELKFAARQISRLVRERGLRYRDFAIVTGAIENYGNYAEDIFRQYGIPVFVDTKKDILYHPFIETIRAMLQIVEHDMSYESVFRYLRSGMSDIEQDKVDILENYVLAMGIRGRKRWSQKWVKVIKGSNDEELILINEMREHINDTLQEIVEVFGDKESDTRARTTALYRTIRSLNMENKLSEYVEYFTAKGDLSKAKEYEQIYKIVMDLFDKIVDLLGDEKLSIKEYCEILDAGFEAAKVGVIPPGHDRVIIGDIERTRVDNVKVMFFIGLNDGIVPKTEASGGIISQLEREQLAESDIELAPTGREKVFIQRFYLYLNMTKPENMLYVTFSQVDQSGSSLRKSYLINTLKKIFPKLQESTDMEGAEDILTPESAMDFYIKGLQDTDKASEDQRFRALNRWYLEQKEWREKIDRLINAAFFSYENEKLQKETAKALYGAVLQNSVSRLEKFTECAYAHFLTYGLQLKERELCEFEGRDMGTIYHDTLEIYSRTIEEKGYSWLEIPEDISREIQHEAFEQAIARYHGEALFENARSSHSVYRMEKMIQRTVWALHCQAKSGLFKPAGYELSFDQVDNLEASNFMLSENERMKLRGRIDRVDTYETEDKVYVKIIDYKSGTTKFKLLSVYHGLQLQLVVYLNAAMEIMGHRYKGKKIEPAGVFYYHLDDPLINTNDTKVESEEQIWQEVLKKLKLDGMLSSEEEAYRAMDKDITSTSNVIPLRLKKDGTPYKDTAVSPEDIGEISKYVHRKIHNIGHDIIDGEISVKPYTLGTSDSCQYCKYHSICGFDQRLPGYEKRKLANISSDQEIINKMKEEMHDGDTVE